MRKVLVVNCGSSSLKYRLYERQRGRLDLLAKGLVERIGEPRPRHEHEDPGRSLARRVRAPDHEAALALMLDALRGGLHATLGRADELEVVAHRVVHGGGLRRATLVDASALRRVRDATALAPLHNPHNLAGIHVLRKALPDVPHVMVFDTAFHAALPAKAATYALPLPLQRRAGIRRYGFHGTSHAYVAEGARRMLGRTSARVITCHLGAGASVAAVKAGRSVDTSMGFTPLEGLMMGTRSGDLDASIVQHLVAQRGYALDEVFRLLNHESGLLGVSGASKDVRVLEQRARAGDARCALALEMFAYRVAKYIGAYAVALGRVDAIVFTAGIGEHSARVRRDVCSYLGVLGAKIDARRNRAASDDPRPIHARGSRVAILVIPTDEELAIARAALPVVRRERRGRSSEALTRSGSARSTGAPPARASRSTSTSRRGAASPAP